MKNERRIKPLRTYEVHQHFYMDGRDVYETEKFTADDHEVVTNTSGETDRVRFYNTGNLIREIFGSPVKMIITPVD